MAAPALEGRKWLIVVSWPGFGAGLSRVIQTLSPRIGNPMDKVAPHEHYSCPASVRNHEQASNLLTRPA